MPDIELVQNRAQLESIRLPWTQLLQQTPRPQLCHCIDWYLEHWEQANAQWQFLVVTSRYEPIGIAPLLREQTKSFLGKRFHLRTPESVDWPYWTPVGGQPAATMTAALRYLVNSPHMWDSISIGPTRDRASESQRLETAMQVAGLRPQQAKRGSHWAIALDGFYHEYFSQLPSDLQQEVRQANDSALFEDVHYQRYRDQQLVLNQLELPIGSSATPG